MQLMASHVLELSTGPIRVADSFRGDLKKCNGLKTVKTRNVPIRHPIG